MKRLWKFLSDAALVATTPSCWLRNHTTSKYWDAALNELMTRNRFKKNGHYTATIGGVQVWVENHPYASFSPYQQDVLPKRSTAIRAFWKLSEDLIREQVETEKAATAKATGN